MANIGGGLPAEAGKSKAVPKKKKKKKPAGAGGSIEMQSMLKKAYNKVGPRQIVAPGG